MTVDLGTGDGAFIYRSARACPERFFIGIDSNAENLVEYSHRATRKPAKGGAPNAIFVCANGEALPEELNGLANELSILFPWGSLLKAVVLPEPSMLAGFHRICQPNAAVRVVLGYNSECEPGLTTNLCLPPLSMDYLNSLLETAYHPAGFALSVRHMEKVEIARIPTTWARKLAFGKDRVFFELQGYAR